MRNAKLPGAKLEEVEGSDSGNAVDMLGASFIRASLRGAKLQGAHLEECDFLEVDFTGSDLAGAVLLRANMSGAILNETNLERADLSELKGWEKIASLRNTKIGGVRNAPEGFIEWALTQGALELTAGRTPAPEAAQE